MHLLNRSYEYVRGELGPVLLVAVGVTLVATVAWSVFDRLHQVVAEEVNATELRAVAGPDNTQLVRLTGWGVQFSAPLAKAMPLLVFATQSSSSVGLSSSDLELAGTQCNAAHDGLGSLIRVKAGTYDQYVHATQYIATIDGYDYAFASSLNSCASVSTGPIISREQSVLVEALNSLRPISQ